MRRSLRNSFFNSNSFFSIVYARNLSVYLYPGCCSSYLSLLSLQFYFVGLCTLRGPVYTFTGIYTQYNTLQNACMHIQWCLPLSPRLRLLSIQVYLNLSNEKYSWQEMRNSQRKSTLYWRITTYDVKKVIFRFLYMFMEGRGRGVVCCCWINCKIVCRGYVYSYFSACNIIVLCHQCQCQHYSDLCRLQSNYIHYIIK